MAPLYRVVSGLVMSLPAASVQGPGSVCNRVVVGAWRMHQPQPAGLSGPMFRLLGQPPSVYASLCGVWVGIRWLAEYLYYCMGDAAASLYLGTAPSLAHASVLCGGGSRAQGAADPWMET